MQSMKDKRSRVGKHSRIGMQSMVSKQAIFYQEQMLGHWRWHGLLDPSSHTLLLRFR